MKFVVMFRNIKRSVEVYTNLKGNLKRKVTFPEKFKGTIVEKWANYWKNYYFDIRQMFVELRNDIQNDPRKAFMWSIALVTACALARNNPNELEFKDALKNISNEAILVSDKCRNPKSFEHIRYLEKGYEQGSIRYKNLGIASIIYTTEWNDGCDLYNTRCSYVNPTYLSFPSQIIDVGFMGKWWNLYIKTNNYDVNF